QLQLHEDNGSLRQSVGEYHAAHGCDACRLLGGTGADGYAARWHGLQRSDLRRERRESRRRRSRIPDNHGSRLFDRLSRPRDRAPQADVGSLDGPRRILVQQRAGTLRARRGTLRYERQSDADVRRAARRRRSVRSGQQRDQRIGQRVRQRDRKSTRLNSSHRTISYAVFCLKKKTIKISSNAHHPHTTILISLLRHPPTSTLFPYTTLFRSYNNAREHFALAEGRYDTNGNPTPTFAEPLVDGGQFAPVSSATSGSGSVFVNAKWQFNANALYVAPLGIETSANVFGRHGYPFPLFRSQALGGESLSVLVTPAIDYFRYDNVWDTDVRAARTFKVQSLSLRVIGDVFNVFNANTVLVRNNNILSTTFNQIGQNLSPRIFRVGVVVGF